MTSAESTLRRHPQRVSGVVAMTSVMATTLLIFFETCCARPVSTSPAP